MLSILPYTAESYAILFGKSGAEGGKQGGGLKGEGRTLGGAHGNGNGKGAGSRTPTSSDGGSDEEWEVEASGMRTTTKPTTSGATVGKNEEAVNGEAVRERVKVLRRGLMAQGISYAVGFSIMVVGIWGDGA